MFLDATMATATETAANDSILVDWVMANPGLTVGVIAVFIAVYSDWRAGKRQKAEWNRRKDEQVEERARYITAIYDGLIEELDIMHKRAKALGKLKKDDKFLQSLDFVPVRPVYSRLGIELAELPKHMVKAICLFEGEFLGSLSKFESACRGDIETIPAAASDLETGCELYLERLRQK